MLPGDDGRQNGDGRKWWILAAVSGVLGLIVLDETVVGVALVTIRHDIGMSTAASHWVVNAYMLAFACLVAVGGRMGDRFGHRRIFVAGAVALGLASLASGLAENGAWLIAARAGQGLGAAILFPASMAMLTRTFPLEKRGTAFGIQTTVGAVFMSLGPLLGGYFAEMISWRWIFWINLPIVVAIILIVVVATAGAAEANPQPALARLAAFDIRGLVTLVVGLTAVIVALMHSADLSWNTRAFLRLFAVGLFLLALFVRTERRRADPLIDLNLLGIATFTGGVLVFAIFQCSKLAVFVFVPVYLQHALGASPIHAGLAVLFAVVPTLVVSPLVGKATDRLGSRRSLMAGLFLHGTGAVLIGVATHLRSHDLIVAALILWGAAMPLVAVPARRALMSAVPKVQQGQASGVNLTLQMVGGTVGIALCGTLLLVTGVYSGLFLMTGALIFMVMAIAWLTVERRGRAYPAV